MVSGSPNRPSSGVSISRYAIYHRRSRPILVGASRSQSSFYRAGRQTHHSASGMGDISYFDILNHDERGISLCGLDSTLVVALLVLRWITGMQGRFDDTFTGHAVDWSDGRRLLGYHPSPGGGGGVNRRQDLVGGGGWLFRCLTSEVIDFRPCASVAGQGSIAPCCFWS